MCTARLGDWLRVDNGHCQLLAGHAGRHTYEWERAPAQFPRQMWAESAETPGLDDDHIETLKSWYRMERPKKKSTRQWQVVAEDREFRLKSCSPKEGLTDDFLRDVAKAYTAAVARGERPNKALADQTGYAKKSVERWVYTARLRGIMPRGRKGQVG